MYRKMFLATSNEGKLVELRALLRGFTIEALKDLDVEEDGTTFAANAVKKAVAAAKAHGAAHPGAVFLGEDSGLEVEPLDGAPGVLSARFSLFTLTEANDLVATATADPGRAERDRRNNEYLLAVLRARGLFELYAGRVPAQYRSAVAVCSPDGTVLNIEEGSCRVSVIQDEQLVHGFGYDAITEHAELGHFGMIPTEEKNRVSHRGQSLRRLCRWMRHRPDLFGALEAA